MAGFINNIKSNIMFAQADHLVKTGNFSKYLSNVKSGKFDIKNEKIKQQFKDFIDSELKNSLHQAYIYILPFQDKLFLANIYPEYMNFDTDPLQLCYIFSWNLKNNQEMELIKKFIEDNNLYSKFGDNLSDYIYHNYHRNDFEKENSLLFLKYLKELGYKPFIKISERDAKCFTEEMQKKLIDNDLITDELADRLWTYSTFENKKFKILDSIKNMSRSYRFWNYMDTNSVINLNYTNVANMAYRDNKYLALTKFGLPTSNFIKNNYIDNFRENGYLERKESEFLVLLADRLSENDFGLSQSCLGFIKVYKTITEKLYSDKSLNRYYTDYYSILKKIPLSAFNNNGLDIRAAYSKYCGESCRALLDELNIAYDLKLNPLDYGYIKLIEWVKNYDDIFFKYDINNAYDESGIKISFVQKLFDELDWEKLISLDYSVFYPQLSYAIYVLDKYKTISNEKIKETFKNIYADNRSIKTRDEVNSLYENAIKLLFNELDWEDIITLSYHDIKNIFSENDVYILDKYKTISSKKIKETFKNMYADNRSIKTRDEVNSLYENAIKFLFNEPDWEDIIALNYHDIKNIFSENDVYALDKYKFLKNYSVKDSFMRYYIQNKIPIEKIDFLCDLINRLNLSNSVELVNFQGAIFDELLKTDEPLKKFESIEKIFIKNNIPVFAKIFKCFQILYPDLSKSFNFKNQKISPELAKLDFHDTNLEKLSKNIQPNDMRLQVIFNDLFRISLGSNNHSLKEYIRNIENGNILYISLLSDKITYDELSTLQKQTLDIFINHLETLLDNSKYKLNENYNNLSSFDKIEMLGQCFKITSRYDLPDRIVRHFLYFAGINSFEELKDKINNVVTSKDKINQERGKRLENAEFILETNDFIRGVGSELDLINSLNMGNVCKEYLGSIKGTSSSDSTPLDIDFSKITFKEDNKTSIECTPSRSGGYGDYYIVIKHDNPNMIVSRDTTGDKDVAYDPDKFEMFKTLADNHYGVRTGISSTDIDYIMIDGDNDISRLKFEIAKNGFYIPVVNIEGNLLYTVSEYNSLKEKMNGLSYYDTENYKLSTEHLYFPGIDKIIANMHEDRERQIKKRSVLQSTIKNILSSSNLGIDKINMKPTPDLSDNNVDLIEIGSTSRGTNVPNDSDYDFILKVGKQQAKQNSKAILSKFSEYFNPKENNSHTNRFRGTNIDIEGFDAPVDIDISIDQKKNSEIYFSDTSLQDRLNNIKRQYPKDYEAVLANIVYAKELLKKEGCYKPYKSDSSQSGLGGIGVENWVLQNGGSLYSAAKSFYDASANKTFDEFKRVYKVWDFGQNHEPREKNGTLYPFDEYISDNMAENGYQKMRDACKRYLEFVKNETFEITQDEQLENDVSMKR